VVGAKNRAILGVFWPKLGKKYVILGVFWPKKHPQKFFFEVLTKKTKSRSVALVLIHHIFNF